MFYTRAVFGTASLYLLALLLSGNAANAQAVNAQIVPDRSLGAERSRLVPDRINDLPVDRIEGGAVRGRHLFHSFREFNVRGRRGAYFANPAGVDTILTRVTGSNPSRILGTLGVLGNADLFLLNPNGILFGANARLDLRGSFLASTADGLQFDNGFTFRASQPQAPPLLQVNVPVGLRFRNRPGTIVNRSAIEQTILGVTLPVGLAVNFGETLALVGGKIRLPNGSLAAFQGNVQLGSVASPGLVGLTATANGLEFDYSNVELGRIELSDAASVNATGLGGGAIQISGGSVTLRDRASIVSDTLGSLEGRDIAIEAEQFRLFDRAFVSVGTAGTGTGGNLVIRAADAVQLRGAGFGIFEQTIEAALSGTLNPLSRGSGLFTGTTGAGRSGNITIATPALTLRDGAVIVSPTFGDGDGGEIAIRQADSVWVSSSGMLTTAFGQGDAGSLTIDTGRLTIRDQAIVSTATFDAGRSGDLTVTAADAVVLREQQEFSPLGTALSTSTVGGTGDAGDLLITTRSLLVDGGATIASASGATADQLLTSRGRGGDLTVHAAESITVTGTSSGIPSSRSQIATATTGAADAGDLRIHTRRLVVTDGGGVGASTVGAGRGGNMFITASESIELVGRTRNNVSPSGIATASGDPLVQSFFPELNPTGSAGNISLSTGRLSIRDGATISVESFGSGRAGTIDVQAAAIELDTGGSIDGTTGSGAGGNINLQAQNIQLRRGSRISTDAAANGGNIRLGSEFLIAFPDENSNITANARTNQGGQVTINVPNIFGLAAVSREQLRDRLDLTDAEFARLRISPTTILNSNDIAAISQAAGPNLQGTVIFNTSGINPAQDLVELPQTVVDPDALIAANACVQTQTSEFVITGRGGLSPSPTDVLSSQSALSDWIEPVQTENAAQPSRLADQDFVDQDFTHQTVPRPESAAIEPAQGWVMTATGEVALTAFDPAGSAQRIRQAIRC